MPLHLCGSPEIKGRKRFDHKMQLSCINIVYLPSLFIYAILRMFKINYDALGITASLACAIHCAVLPLLMTSLPVFGINIINNYFFEAPKSRSVRTHSGLA